METGETISKTKQWSTSARKDKKAAYGGNADQQDVTKTSRSLQQTAQTGEKTEKRGVNERCKVGGRKTERGKKKIVTS